MKTFFKYITIAGLLLLISCSEDTVGESLTGTISGKVVENSSNEPLENVKITTTPASSTVFTDENGEFVIEDVLIDQYSVKAEIKDYTTAFEAVTVTEGATSNVAFELLKSGANNRQPSTPQLVSPEDNAEEVDMTAEFVWNSSDPEDDELTYELELWNNVNEEVLRYSNIQDTTYTVEGLNSGYRYFWQVKVSDSVNDPVLSPLYSFRTRNVPESRILFTRLINGNNVIYSRNSEGEEFRLTSPDQNSFRPRKNNSVNKIAFLRVVNGQTHLFTMNPDGSQEKRITSNIPVNGFNLNMVDFSWADDGAALVYPNFSKLYKINSTGGGTTLIYETQNGDFITEVDVSENNETIALITNNSNGYDADLLTINFEGEIQERILNNVEGALGGIDLSLQGDKILYTYDSSGFRSDSYRRLDSELFIYDFSTRQFQNLSVEKSDGTNDLDPRFSPNEAEVIFVNTSNDDLSPKDIYTMPVNTGNSTGNEDDREMLIENAAMPDWE
ncbi:carboxypeptidase regulatory-like domain-containing protein [Salinimicrobium tongyeongense]|uniref:Carboxypeptidase regulatory-like domain-containing protein n=1 Tax=Salinimicrobium tongyeongense TaxID=2809707 RepID=A0ABY6NU29_9FLAO|nr:carboxypeptidase regulatory-like domain-containing protein [Salinimicrobium tongyeongense]UZH56086.1 carboxypeptidase regulatory-like domain-containing protein [Salinimicrobium tongyeongense]